MVSGKLHAKTPLVESPKLSKLAGRQVLLKLDNLQPSGSFKIRGIGNLVQEGKKENKLSAGKIIDDYIQGLVITAGLEKSWRF